MREPESDDGKNSKIIVMPNGYDDHRAHFIKLAVVF